MSATSTLKLGSLPVMRGTYDNSANYYKANEVTMYGMTFRAKTGTEASPLTGYAPATLSNNLVTLTNTDKWDLTSGTPENYNLVQTCQAEIAGKTDKVVPAESGNIPMLNASGNLEDSDINIDDVFIKGDRKSVV